MNALHRTALILALGALMAPAVSFASESIATKAGCAACHNATKKVLGPSYRDVAAKYKGKGDVVALLSERVRKGSTGVWGPVAMPATDTAKINDTDLTTVVAWILKTPG